MTSLEYYIEQVKQFISMLTDDIKSGYGTIVTQTKLAVYREVLKHLEEIGQEQSYNSIKTELNGDAISRQAVIDEAFEVDTKEYGRIDVVGVDAIDSLPPVTPQPKTGHWIWCIGSHKCSNCEEYTCFSHKELLRYCPNCGAKMEVSE